MIDYFSFLQPCGFVLMFVCTDSSVQWSVSEKMQLFPQPRSLCLTPTSSPFSSVASPGVSQKESNPVSSAEGTVANEGEEIVEPASKKQDPKKTSQIKESDSESEISSDEEKEISTEDLIRIVQEKEDLLKKKHNEIKVMQEKVLRSYAEAENVMDRARREAENTKKFAIQVFFYLTYRELVNDVCNILESHLSILVEFPVLFFSELYYLKDFRCCQIRANYSSSVLLIYNTSQSFAKSLLDVADNLSRASSVVKESFSKIDTSKDSSGAAPLLKTLLEGVAMTEKQLSDVIQIISSVTCFCIKLDTH